MPPFAYPGQALTLADHAIRTRFIKTVKVFHNFIF